MIERRQPIVIAVDADGEFIWGEIDMPRWQMELLPVRYKGDFSEHWMYKAMREQLDMPWSASQPYAGKPKTRWPSWGD